LQDKKQCLDETHRKLLKRKIEEYLESLERLAKIWDLIDQGKYKHRMQFYGINDAAVNLIPRRSETYK